MKKVTRVLSIVILLLSIIACEKFEILETFPAPLALPDSDKYSFDERYRNCEILYSSEEIAIALSQNNSQAELENNLLFQAANIINEANPNINFKPTSFPNSANINFLDGKYYLNEPNNLANDRRIFNSIGSTKCTDCIGMRFYSGHISYIKSISFLTREPALNSYVYTLGHYLGLPDSQDKESWMYPYYIEGVKKSFKKPELDVLLRLENLCAKNDRIDSKLLNVSTEGKAQIQVDYTFAKPYPDFKVGVIIAEDTASLYLEKSSYYLKTISNASDITVFSTEVLNANQRFYAKAFIYGRTGTVYDTKIIPIDIPNRNNNKWVKMDETKFPSSTTYKPVYFSNEIFMANTSSGNDELNAIHLFTLNGGYYRMNLPFYYKEIDSFYYDDKFYAFTNDINTDKIVIYQFDIFNLLLKAIVINKKDYNIGSIPNKRNYFLFENSGNIYLMANLVNGKSFVLLNCDFKQMIVTSLKQSSEVNYSSILIPQFISNGNKLLIYNNPSNYNLWAFTYYNNLLTINKESFEINTLELFPIRFDSKPFKSHFDSADILLRDTAYVSTGEGVYRLKKTSYRTLSPTGLSKVDNFEKVKNRAWPLNFLSDSKYYSRQTDVFQLVNVFDKTTVNLCTPPTGTDLPYTKGYPLGISQINYRLFDAKDKIYLFLSSPKIQDYKSIWVYYK